MIKTFHDTVTEMIFHGARCKRIDETLQKKARRRLEFLNATKIIEDLYFPPSNRFHKLQGFKPPRYSISVDAQWRITFEWSNGDSYDVHFADYH